MSTRTQESNGKGNFDQDDPRMQGSYYISSLQTKRNPDLIIPGGSNPLKGNLYFRRVGEVEQNPDPEADAQNNNKQTDLENEDLDDDEDLY